MQVVSRHGSLLRTHFQAPPATRLAGEMADFISWLNDGRSGPIVVQAALAHLRFLTIHPFEDGNGRLARALTEWVLARGERSALRFYSLSAQIQREKDDYYAEIEGVEKLHYCEFGAPFSPVEDMTLDLETHRLSIDCYHEGADAYRKTNEYLRLDHVCTDEEWRFVTEKLAESGIGRWKVRYYDPNVLDGTFWRLELLKGTNVVQEYSGANAWPKTFGSFFAIKKFAMKHPMSKKKGDPR